MEENSLLHYGIKGQRWGIRRYENEDGSLTEAGLRRYRVYDDIKSGVKTIRKDIRKSIKKNSEIADNKKEIRALNRNQKIFATMAVGGAAAAFGIGSRIGMHGSTVLEAIENAGRSKINNLVAGTVMAGSVAVASALAVHKMQKDKDAYKDNIYNVKYGKNRR